MFDIIESRVTASLARKLIAFSNISPMDISDEIWGLAEDDLLPRFTQRDEIQQAIQLLADYKFRGIMVDQTKQRLGLSGLLEYLKSIGHDKIIYAIPASQEATHVKQELKMFQDIVPGKYLVKNNKEHYDDTNAFVIYKCMNWGTRHIEMTKWAFSQNEVVGYYPHGTLLDTSTISSILEFHAVLMNDDHRDEFILETLTGASNQKLVFELFGMPVITTA